MSGVTSSTARRALNSFAVPVGKHSIKRPMIKSPSHCIVGHSQNAHPVRHAVCSALICNVEIRPAITRLLLACSPLDVAGFIAPHVVRSINRMSWRWSWPNLVVEREKVSAPFRRESNSAPSIIRIQRRAWLETSSLNSVPYAILWRVVHTMSPPAVALSAITRCSSLAAQCVASYDYCFSTITKGFIKIVTPRRIATWLFMVKSNHRKITAAVSRRNWYSGPSHNVHSLNPLVNRLVRLVRETQISLASRLYFTTKNGHKGNLK